MQHLASEIQIMKTLDHDNIVRLFDVYMVCIKPNAISISIQDKIDIFIYRLTKKTVFELPLLCLLFIYLCSTAHGGEYLYGI